MTEIEKLNDIINKYHGYYDDDNRWNAIITFPGDRHIYRDRVETIIVRNKSVFMKRTVNGEYYLPGGSVDRDMLNSAQAIKECREEAHINVAGIYYSGISYKSYKDNFIHKKDEIWDARYNRIYVADYAAPYDGPVAKCDRDPFIASGSWIPIRECLDFMNEYHKKALVGYLHSKHEQEERLKEKSVMTTESYFTNYFKNKIELQRLLRDKDKKTLELMRATNRQLIKDRKKMLKKYKSGCYLASVAYQFKRNNGLGKVKTVGFLIDITKSHGNNSPYATTVDKKGAPDEYPDYIVCVNDYYFNLDEESQLFVLLHELGHIVLGHTDDRNGRFLGIGLNFDKLREIHMSHGSVTYMELNADLFALINGAKMYPLLRLMIHKDKDKKYYYAATDNELAKRYSNLYNFRQKHIGQFRETADGSLIDDNGDELVFVESISAKERRAIPLNEFGIPEKRAYPLDTEKHVRSAIKLFWRAPKKYKKKLAHRIVRAMKKYDLPMDLIGKDNEINHYLHKK